MSQWQRPTHVCADSLHAKKCIEKGNPDSSSSGYKGPILSRLQERNENFHRFHARFKYTCVLEKRASLAQRLLMLILMATLILQVDSSKFVTGYMA